MTKCSGILDLLPQGAKVDDFSFEPYGYSMNAIWNQNYYSIHVTPQEQCSYASFELGSTASGSAASLKLASALEGAVSVFLPQKMVLSVAGRRTCVSELLAHTSHLRSDSGDSLLVVAAGHGMAFDRTSSTSTLLYEHSDSICVVESFVVSRS